MAGQRLARPWEALDGQAEHVESDLRRVDALLDHVASSAPPPLAEAVGRAVTARGKGVRPLVTLLCFHACEGPPSRLEQACRAGAAVELLHTASLLVDDVVDQSAWRRGVPTLAESHGPRQALLAAGHLCARGFRLIAQGEQATEGIQDEVDHLAQGFEDLLAGEALSAGQAREPTPEDWERIARDKTGALFALAATLGARRAQAHHAVGDLEVYGFALGVAFQAADDRLDATGCRKALGKPAGQDARNGAPNAVHLLGQKGARLLASKRAQAACRALEVLPPSPHRSALAELARWAADREV